jgi:type VI secretion system protein ImpA
MARPTALDSAGLVSLELRDRADALRRLAAIADFFHHSEPHSPVAYLIERAVRWGQMPLEQWLNDVISDQGVLSHIRETLGIKNSEQDGG